MAFRKIKKQFLSRRFQKELQLAPETKTQNRDEIHTVAILTTQEFYETMKLPSLIKEYISTVRTVQVYYYKPFKKGEENTFKYFTENNFDRKGAVLDASFQNFLDNPFHLLIGFFERKNLYLEFAALKSNAAFKIGFSGVNDKIFDLVIAEEPKNIDSFLTECRKYLQILDKL